MTISLKVYELAHKNIFRNISSLFENNRTSINFYCKEQYARKYVKILLPLSLAILGAKIRIATSAAELSPDRIDSTALHADLLDQRPGLGLWKSSHINRYFLAINQIYLILLNVSASTSFLNFN